MLMIAMLLAAAQDEGVLARQVRVPVDQVLGSRIELSDADKRDAKERERHNRVMEKVMKRLDKDGTRFMLGQKEQKAKPLKFLPANSSKY